LTPKRAVIAISTCGAKHADAQHATRVETLESRPIAMAR
jgi:hypothetical protein